MWTESGHLHCRQAVRRIRAKPQRILRLEATQRRAFFRPTLPLPKVGSVTVGDFDGKAVPAMLYKVTKPANLALLMENTLCGRNPVTYIAVRPFAGCGRSLNVYYGSKQPSGVNSSGLCGTFNNEAR